MPQFRVLAAFEIPVHDTSAHSPPRASTPLVAVGALASLTADSLRLTHTHTRVSNSASAASTTRTLPSSLAVPTPPLFSPAPRIARGVSPASSPLEFDPYTRLWRSNRTYLVNESPASNLSHSIGSRFLGISTRDLLASAEPRRSPPHESCHTRCFI